MTTSWQVFLPCDLYYKRHINRWFLRVCMHYNDVIMSTMVSQITSLAIIYSTVYSGTDKKNIKAPRHWPLLGEFTGDRWIPRTKGQWRGKCFHLMTSSWMIPDNMYSLPMLFAIISPPLFSLLCPASSPAPRRCERVPLVWYFLCFHDEREKERKNEWMRNRERERERAKTTDRNRDSDKEREEEVGTLKTKDRQLNNFVPLLAS